MESLLFQQILNGLIIGAIYSLIAIGLTSTLGALLLYLSIGSRNATLASLIEITYPLFVVLFAWLLFVNRRAQKVKQFNIVFAAERPYRPETTHYAWNFYAPYRKALGFLTWPLFERFWGSLVELLHTLADLLRRYYNGNGQVYAIQLLAFVVIVYLFTPGG